MTATLVLLSVLIFVALCFLMDYRLCRRRLDIEALELRVEHLENDVAIINDDLDTETSVEEAD